MNIQHEGGALITILLTFMGALCLAFIIALVVALR